MSRRHRVRHQPRAGFTLVELMLVLILLGVLASLAVPSLADFIARKRVESTANEVLTTLKLARTLPQQINNEIIVKFGSNNANCYTIHSFSGLATCDCATGSNPVCTQAANSPLALPTEYSVIVAPIGSGITFSRNTDEVRYDAYTALPNRLLTIDIGSVRGGILRVSTSSVGRPAICNVSGHNSFPAC